MDRQKLNTIIISVVISISISLLIILAAVKIGWFRANVYISEVPSSNQVADRDMMRSAIDLQDKFLSAAHLVKSTCVYLKVLQRPGSEVGFLNQNLALQHGSGILITADGYIATNFHVVENAVEITVLLDNKQEFKAKVIGEDPFSDIALLKIEASDLPFLNFANSDFLNVGQWVIAAGNPYRLQSTISAGIISALSRNINSMDSRGIESYIQTDVTANSGSSGGPLVNLDGELVGMITAVITDSGGHEGFSFAVPSNLIKKISADLISYGVAQRAWLGIETEMMDSRKAASKKMDKIKGVLINTVEAGSAASKSGIIAGDVLTAINTTEINNPAQLSEKLALYNPGDIIDLSIYRDGKDISIKTILTNHLKGTEKIAINRGGIFAEIGIEVRDLTKEEKNELFSDGVYVVSVQKSSKAGKANIAPGFIITSASGKKVNNIDNLKTIIENNRNAIELEGRYKNFPGIFPYIIRLD